MSQSLVNLMNSPLAVTALLLWTALVFLAVRTCRRWAKERHKVKTIMKNHPAIPVKEYKLSDFSVEAVTKPGATSTKVLSPEKFSTEQQARRRVYNNFVMVSLGGKSGLCFGSTARFC